MVFHPHTFLRDELKSRKISWRSFKKILEKWYDCSYTETINYKYFYEYAYCHFLEEYLGIEKEFWINTYEKWSKAIQSGDYEKIDKNNYYSDLVKNDTNIS